MKIDEHLIELAKVVLMTSIVADGVRVEGRAIIKYCLTQVDEDKLFEEILTSCDKSKKSSYETGITYWKNYRARENNL